MEKNEEFIINFNKNVLSNVAGQYKQLEVINSASPIFELPKTTWNDILIICKSKKITALYFECHYIYRKD